MWKCTGCGYPNPDNRSICFKCNTYQNSTDRVQTAASEANPSLIRSSRPIELLRQTVQPEELIAASDWRFMSSIGTNDAVLMLTATMLYASGPDSSVDNIKSGSIKLSAISGLSCGRLTPGYTGSDVVRVVFERPAIGIVIYECDYPDGMVFTEALKHAIMSPASSGESTADALSKLAGLRSSGALSEDEFDRAKATYLGKSLDKRNQMLLSLRSLYDLRMDGVLSEGEFNIKKWDILSRNDI